MAAVLFHSSFPPFKLLVISPLISQLAQLIRNCASPQLNAKRGRLSAASTPSVPLHPCDATQS